MTKYAKAAPHANRTIADAMKGPTNLRSTGRRPGDTNDHVCQRITGSARMNPMIAAILMGTVSPSVGLVKIA